VKKAITLGAVLDVPRIENTKRVTATLAAVQILKGKQKERCAIRPPEGEKRSDITASRSRLSPVVR
jgi:hypothetical protein